MISFYKHINIENGINMWGEKGTLEDKHSIGTLFYPGESKGMFQAGICQ